MIEKVPEEHRPGENLMPVPGNGEGWIGAAVFADQEAEARYIATEIDRLHKQDEVDWKDIAILVRSRRYLDAVLSALDERDIPFEMPDLGGLLKVQSKPGEGTTIRIVVPRDRLR